MKIPTLTPSQRASLVSGVLGLVVWAGGNIPAIEAVVPIPKELKSALILACMLIPHFCRSLNTSMSGTGTGIVNTGPDTRAASAITGTASADPTAPPAAGTPH